VFSDDKDGNSNDEFVYSDDDGIETEGDIEFINDYCLPLPVTKVTNNRPPLPAKEIDANVAIIAKKSVGRPRKETTADVRTTLADSPTLSPVPSPAPSPAASLAVSHSYSTRSSAKKEEKKVAVHRNFKYTITKQSNSKLSNKSK
jgi:hypothetical protein